MQYFFVRTILMKRIQSNFEKLRIRLRPKLNAVRWSGSSARSCPISYRSAPEDLANARDVEAEVRLILGPRFEEGVPLILIFRSCMVSVGSTEMLVLYLRWKSALQRNLKSPGFYSTETSIFSTSPCLTFPT